VQIQFAPQPSGASSPDGNPFAQQRHFQPPTAINRMLGPQVICCPKKGSAAQESISTLGYVNLILWIYRVFYLSAVIDAARMR
jgi:hypothetical protein